MCGWSDPNPCVCLVTRLNVYVFQQSQHDLFARKFEAIVNQKVINLLEEHLFGEFPSGMQALDTYWENSHHHLDGNRLSDTLRTYFASFSRLATKYVSNRHCQNAPIGQFKEITYIKVDDEFSGMLLLQDVSLRQARSVTMETWFSRADREQMMNLNMGEAPSRLTGLQVSKLLPIQLPPINSYASE